jgi:hypothetical protein
MEISVKNAYFQPLRLEYRLSRSLPTCRQIGQVLSILPLELGNFPSAMGYLSRPLWPILAVCSQA